MNWLSHSIEDRRIILRQTAEAESLPEYAIEKDWWVTMTLKAIFQTECAASLLFKGGTSLSKGWKLIQRFSEDIDLSIDHQYFRETVENNNQLKMLRKQCRRYVVDMLVGDIDCRMEAMGLSGYRIYPVVEQGGNKVSTDSDPTEIIIEYPSIIEMASDYVRPAVKVEISCLSMKEPFEGDYNLDQRCVSTCRPRHLGRHSHRASLQNILGKGFPALRRISERSASQLADEPTPI